MATKRRKKAGLKRQNTRKFVSTAIQGPASYISFFKPKWQEIRDAADDLRATSDVIRTEEGRIDAGKAEEELSANLWGLATSKFEQWNWIDDDGEDLAPMTEIEAGSLYGDEIDFVFNCVQRLYMLQEEPEGN